MQVYSGNRDRPSGRAAALMLLAPLVAFALGCGHEPPPADADPSGEPAPASAEPAAPSTETHADQEQAAEPVDQTDQADQQGGDLAEVAITHPPTPQPLPAPEGATRLSPEHDVWIDVKRGVVIVDGNVSLRRGMLEMFACTRNTKEHESVVSAKTMAFTVHAALLRLGAKTGEPVRFEPEYAPPTGTEIEITIEWRGDDGELEESPAQKWVRDMRTGEEMTLPWVFAGSWTAEHEETGEKAYMAEGGDFICVSNFSTAMLDVPAESTQSEEGLLFEAYTERIPPLGTPVRMILRPKPDAKDPGAAENPKDRDSKDRDSKEG